MIKKQQICKALFAACMLLGSSTVFAQVKIGTNPTLIETNSNLEVEAATTGRKVKVDKNSGQLTIKDGTEGTGKVLTSDATGGASWQNTLAGSMTNGTDGPYANVATFSPTYTNSGASINLPKAGTYIVYAKWVLNNTGIITGFTDAGHCYINTCLSTSNVTNTVTGITAEWVYATGGEQHSVPGFRVTVGGPQILYFWFFTGFFTGNIRMLETYAIGPF